MEIRAIDPRTRRVYTQPKPSVAVAPKATPKTLPKTAPKQKVAKRAETLLSKNMYIQVAAFGSRENAENLRQKLKNMSSMSVHIIEAGEVSKPIFRVRLGPIVDAAEAINLMPRLAELGITGANVISD